MNEIFLELLGEIVSRLSIRGSLAFPFLWLSDTFNWKVDHTEWTNSCPEEVLCDVLLSHRFLYILAMAIP